MKRKDNEHNEEIKARIYKITNKINSKIYIGKTIMLLIERWQNHCKSALRYNSNTYLHRAIRKYSPNAFTIEALREFSYINVHNLNHVEKYYIRKFKSDNPKYGYNMTEGGDGVTIWTDEMKYYAAIRAKNKIWTNEARKKISIAMIGNKYNLGRISPNRGIPASQEQKMKQSKFMKGKIPWIKGKHHSEETRAKIRVARAKQVITKETREKLSLAFKRHPYYGRKKGNGPNLGRHWSQETRNKISETLKEKYRSGEKSKVAHIWTSESRKRLSEANKGKKASQKTREKMSRSQRKLWEKRRMLPNL